MNYEVTMTVQAKNDLRSIYAYIAFDLQAPQSASEQLTRLENRIYSLDSMPERFRACEKEPWRSRNLRIMPVDNYIVFYIPDHEKARVTIIRVMYSRRDFERHLRELLP